MKKAELVRAHAERFLNEFLESVARGAGLGFVVFFSAVFGVLVGHIAVKNARANGHNLVEVPSYAGKATADADDEYPKPEFKYQYEPADDEKPILKKKAQKEEVAHGAKYEAGEELVVEPMSPDFDTADYEEIADEETKGSEPVPSPSPAPTSAASSGAVQKIDIGRRAAEVR